MHKPQFSAAGLTENKCNVFFRKLSSMLLFKTKQNKHMVSLSSRRRIKRCCARECQEGELVPFVGGE